MLCPECGTHNVERAPACAGCGCPLTPPFTASRQPDPPAGAGRSRRSELETLTPVPSDASERERMTRLVREASGGCSRSAQSLPSGREQEEDDILRDFLSLVFEINRQVTREGGQSDKQALASLYTARSFSSPEAMGRATRAVRELFQVNRRVATGVQKAFDRAKRQVKAAKWSDEDKLLFWSEFTEGFAAKFQLRSVVLESQREWVESTAEVYEFALCHSDELRFEGKTVRASNREIGREFVAKVRHAKHCRDEFRAAAARYHRAQASVLIHGGATAPPVS